uniref:LOB domain-containing protein n=1 Tax=Brassica campestris TaxID=3711 RepID=M4DS70_BRACM
MAIWAACEFMTGPCTFGNGNACIMAPYFPLTEPKKFDRINKVFGVVNVYKILSRLEELWQHQYAVNALCYEAEARIHDPIHGYLGVLPKTLDTISQLDTLDLRNKSLSGFVPPGLKKLNERFQFENNTDLWGLDFPPLRACSAFDDVNIELKQPRGETDTDKSTLHNMSDSGYLKQHCSKVALTSSMA